MNILRYIILIIPLFTFVGFANENNNSQDILVKNLDLKISLIETAYEIYTLNEESEEKYKQASNFSFNHYKWLEKTKNSFDQNTLNNLETVFKNNSSWQYINILITLDDDLKHTNIINFIKNDTTLNLSDLEKKAFEDFFNFFYENHFKYYFNKQKFFLSNKQKTLNQNLNNEKTSVTDFIEDVSGKTISKKYNTTFYFSLNPNTSSYFIKNDNLISTISDYQSLSDILRICFNTYSKDILNPLLQNKEFLYYCNKLKNNQNLIKSYEPYKSAYSFEEWCVENLVEGFCKYLDYRYYNIRYEFSNYFYDLDFYNYLRSDFNSKKDDLIEICVNFYKN